VQQGSGARLVRDLLYGAIGGLVGTAVMDQVTTLMYYKLESEEGRKREESIGGESMPRAVIRIVSQALTGARPSDGTVSKLAPAVHWAYGATWGALYGLAHDRAPALSAAGGAPFGATFWLVGDEGLPTALGFAPPPQAFPVTSHVRGLVAHLVYAAAADGVYRALRRLAG